jgi:hypothetical protein
VVVRLGLCNAMMEADNILVSIYSIIFFHAFVLAFAEFWKIYCLKYRDVLTFDEMMSLKV